MLEQVIHGVTHKPPRLFIYGIHGIGKSSLAARAPKAIFLPTEDGASEIDVPKMPVAKSHADVLAQLRALYSEPHEYETAVIDTADWLEDFIHLELKASYSEKELSFGKDSVRAAEKMSEVLTAMNHVREKRNMGCIMLAHTEIKRFDSPMSEPYDRYQPKLQARMGSLLQEWADAVLFMNYDVVVKKEDVGFNREVRRGIATGGRKLFTEERPAFYAKNRYNMPVELDLLDTRESKENPFNEIAKHIPWYSVSDAQRAQQQEEAAKREKAAAKEKK